MTGPMKPGTRHTSLSADDELGMEVALRNARAAVGLDEVPVGAALVRDGVVIAAAHNETVARRDPTRHAEMLVLEHALGVLQTDRLTDCTLCITLEPCAQCAGAIVLAKVGKRLSDMIPQPAQRKSLSRLRISA